MPEARSGGSAAELLLDAGHQLLLGAVVQDGRLPLRPPAAAARGPAGQKHRQGVRRQDVAFQRRVFAEFRACCALGTLSWSPEEQAAFLSSGFIPALSAQALPAGKGEGPEAGRAQFKSRPHRVLARGQFFL